MKTRKVAPETHGASEDKAGLSFSAVEIHLQNEWWTMLFIFWAVGLRVV